MQTLSPTLLAAQRTLVGVATVRLRVEDHELRWLPVLDDDTSTRQTSSTSAAGAILRARISAAGTLDVQRIVDPHSIAQWQNWSTLLSGVAPASDVALSVLEGDPARVRLFCTRPDGATFKLSWLQSADGGQSWSAPADLVTGLPVADGALASANAQLFFHDRGSGYLKLALRNGWEEGTWLLESWTVGGALALRFGVGLGYHNGLYLLASADEESTNVRRLRTGYYTATTHTFTSPAAIVPPGLPSSAFTPLYPSLLWADGAWRMAYLESLRSTLNYTQPLVLHSSDGEHWSYACPVPVRSFAAPRRAALFYYAGDHYLAAECCIWRAASYDPASADCTLMTADLLSYQIEEETGHGRALFDLANPGGCYDCLGESGLPGAPLKPLARVVLERGYHTAAGEERVTRAPYYLITAAVRRGGGTPSLRLECEDGWGLLRRWRPDGVYTWTGKTIAWLLAEVLCRATGLGCLCDGASNWTTVLDSFVLMPAAENVPGAQAAAQRERRALPRSLTVRGSGLAAVQALLAKAGGSARWQPDGRLFCYVPWKQTLADPYIIGSGNEILDALYGRGLAAPNQVAVFGAQHAALATAPSALAGPRRYLSTLVDLHLTSSLACLEYASAAAHAAEAQRFLGWVETPCQCQLELGDLLWLQDKRAGEMQGVYLRAAALSERYAPAEGAFTTRVTFEGA